MARSLLLQARSMPGATRIWHGLCQFGRRLVLDNYWPGGNQGRTGGEGPSPHPPQLGRPSHPTDKPYSRHPIPIFPVSIPPSLVITGITRKSAGKISSKKL